MLYRVRQFWQALTEQPLTAAQFAPARRVLSASQLALFTRLQVSEQHHALRVLALIEAQGETTPDLLAAAVLHDIGKIRHPLRLWERVVIVLGRRFFPTAAHRWGQAAPRGLKRPFVVAHWHPHWGATLVKDAGASVELIQLVALHQAPIPKDLSDHMQNLLAILQQADHQS